MFIKKLLKKSSGFNAAPYYSSGSAASDPTTIFGSNLLAWYKADVGVTGSPSVTAVADQSGNGFNCDNGPNTSPTFSATSFNGGPGITFATGNSLFSSVFNAASTNATFWIVFSVASVPADRMLSYCDPAGADFSPTSSTIAVRALSTTVLQCFYRSVSANSTYAVSTNYRYIYVMNGTNQTAYLNAVQSAQITTATPATLGSASHKLQLGKNTNGNGPAFTVAEWGMAKQDGTSTVTTLDNYMKTKWGL